MMFNFWEENGELQHESIAEVRQTIRDVYGLWWRGLINYTSWTIAIPVEGAELYDIARRHGMIDENYYPSDTWDIHRFLSGVSEREFNSVYAEARRQQALTAGNSEWRNYRGIARKLRTTVSGKPDGQSGAPEPSRQRRAPVARTVARKAKNHESALEIPRSTARRPMDVSLTRDAGRFGDGASRDLAGCGLGAEPTLHSTGSYADMSYEIRILTNMRRMASMYQEDPSVEIRLIRLGGPMSAVAEFLRSFRYGYVLLNGEPRTAFALLALKAVFPFHRTRVVLLDIMLSAPRSFRARVKARLVGSLLARTHRIMVYYRNTKGIQAHFGIPAERFEYIPFKVNQDAFIARTPPTDGGYVFCGGKTRRDFATLFEAVDGLDIPVKVVTAENADMAQHASFADERSAPRNVEIVRSKGDPNEFIQQMAGARLVVLPITPEICGAGISVYLQAMAMKKCVIMSAGPGAEDVLTEGQAIIVPPCDPAALRGAIEKAFDDPDYRESVAQVGYEWAKKAGGEKQLYENVLAKLRSNFEDGATRESLSQESSLVNERIG
jgi:glycosyltransferase involved in cell wall biosynthesis